MQRYNFVASRAIPKSYASLLFVQFYRHSVGVAEEHKLFAGVFVRADRFVRDALVVEFADSCREVVHLEARWRRPAASGYDGRAGGLGKENNSTTYVSPR